MESSRLTDEQLIELALQESAEESEERFDVAYYQETHRITDGSFKIYKRHLYAHYKKWSIDPVSLSIFYDIIRLTKKDKDWFYINKNDCNIDLNKVVGDYVKEKRKYQKEKRFR
jgi:hypothetical protein